MRRSAAIPAGHFWQQVVEVRRNAELNCSIGHL
jgi:hypothetical protein